MTETCERPTTDELRILIAGSISRKVHNELHPRGELWIRELVGHLLMNYPTTVILSGGRKGKVDEAVIRAYASMKAASDESQSLKGRLHSFIATGEAEPRRAFGYRDGYWCDRSPTRFSRRLLMVKLADVVVVVGGETGTPQIVGAAQILEKPIVPLPFAGGVAYQMFDKWDEEVAPTHSKATAVKPSWQGQKDLGEWDQLGCDASEVAERIVQAATVSCFLSQPHHEFGADVSAAVRRVALEVGFSVEEQLDAPTSGSLYDDLDRRIGRSIVTIAIVHDQRYRSAADRDDLSVNPNVLFELGLAAGLGHKLVVVSRTGQNVPFDIKQYRRIEWPAVVTQQAESVREQRVLRFEGQLRDLLRHAREVRRNRPRE